MQSQSNKYLGIGKFTIADDNFVGQADLGVNFFLDEDCLEKSRSECCVKLLEELNPDVKGDWFPKHKVEHPMQKQISQANQVVLRASLLNNSSITRDDLR